MDLWKVYVGLKKPADDAAGAKPGPISNEELLEDQSKFYSLDRLSEVDSYNVVLRPELRENADYKILSAERWAFLRERYGCPVPDIKRRVFVDKKDGKERVEVYFQKINLVVLTFSETIGTSSRKPIYCSSKCSILSLKSQILRTLGSPKYGLLPASCKVASDFHLWKLDPQRRLEDVTKAPTEFPGVCLDLFGERHITKCEIADTDTVVVEPQRAGSFAFRFPKNAKIGRCEHCCRDMPLTVVCACGEASYCSETCRRNNRRYHTEKCTIAGESPTEVAKTERSNMGRTGLQNLGNTCFMNSGIQCLSNTWELVRYFLEGTYKKDVNPANPLGMQGKIAEAFAKLANLLWYDSSLVVAPWHFKKVIGKYRPSFSGFSQQDSHEFLSYVLDGLHEDLNRVASKPYLPVRTGEDPADNSLSELAWNDHLARNRSVVVDLFHGQYKSTLQCTKCGKYSITFDPFASVSLPIPRQDLADLDLIYVPDTLNGRIKKCTALLPRKQTVRDLAELVERHFAEPVILALLSDGTVDSFPAHDVSVSLLEDAQKKRKSKLYAFQVKSKPTTVSAIQPTTILLSVMRGFDARPPLRVTKERIAADRIFLLHKPAANLKDLHIEVFKSVRPMLEGLAKSVVKDTGSTGEQAWRGIFRAVSEGSSTAPYSLRFVATSALCPLCGKASRCGANTGDHLCSERTGG